MIFLYFLLAVLILIVLLLVCPLGVAASLSSSKLRLKLIVLGIPITIPTAKKTKKPKRSKAKKAKKTKAKGQEDAAKPKRAKKSTDVMEILELVSDILPHIGRFFGRLCKSIIISRLEIFLLLYNEDYSKLGRAVGCANAVLSGIRPALASTFTLRDYRASASGSFGIDYKNIAVDAKIFVVPIVIIVAALKLGIFIFKRYRRQS